MVKRSEIGEFGGLWLGGHGLPEESEALDASSRVRRAAPRRQMPPEEPVVARYGAAKTAALTVLADGALARRPVVRAARGRCAEVRRRRLAQHRAVEALLGELGPRDALAHLHTYAWATRAAKMGHTRSEDVSWSGI